MFTYSLFRPLLLLFFCLGASSTFAAAPYKLNVGDYYGTQPTIACALFPLTSIYPRSFSFSGDGWKATAYTEQVTANGSSSTCNYYFSKEGYSNKTGSGTSGGLTISAISLSQCVSGETSDMQFPMGREFPGSETPYQDFGFPFPTTACFSGCNATFTDSSPPFTLPESDDTSVVYSDLTFTKDGSTCSSSTAAPSPPELPPAPEPVPCTGTVDPVTGVCTPADTGGGDTGGGDTGGGDTGGGDTGGGSTGGTDTTVDPTPGPGTAPQEPGPGGEGTTSVASGMSCEQSTTCSGDAIQCAILLQQKAERCLEVENSNYPAQKDAIGSLVDGPEFELEETEIAAPSLLDQHGRFLAGSTCPPPESFTLNHGGGHTLEFSYEPICGLAEDLSWLIVAFATLASALYIGRSFGGG